jgi:hypothetical protein
MLIIPTIYREHTAFGVRRIGEWKANLAQTSTAKRCTSLGVFHFFLSRKKQHKVWEKKENEQRDRSHPKNPNSREKNEEGH